MRPINFKHLHYFWTVARSGSIARAAAQLHVTPQSISGQLREFEESLGVDLLRRAGRGLEPTEVGRRVAVFADEIFALGDALRDTVREQAARRAVPFRIGVADSVPKAVAYRVIEPALHLSEPVRLVCREGPLASLLAELAVHRLDLVIADRPLPGDLNVRGYSHLLGTSDISVFAAPSLAKTLRGAFPDCLAGAPFLLPGEGVALRAKLAAWFEERELHPRIVGEFDDSALMKAFGQSGAGLFAAPTPLAADIARHYGVKVIGRVEAVTEQLYAITTERRIRHPVSMAVSETAQREIFGPPPPRAATGRASRSPGRTPA